MACLGGNQTHINANTRGGGVPGLLEGGVEDQLAAGGGAEPGVIHQLLLQLAGIPTRIAQTNQGLLRAFTNGDGFENVTAGGQDQAITCLLYTSPSPRDDR